MLEPSVLLFYTPVLIRRYSPTFCRTWVRHAWSPVHTTSHSSVVPWSTLSQASSQALTYQCSNVQTYLRAMSCFTWDSQQVYCILNADSITLKQCEVHSQSQHIHLEHQHINSQESGHIFEQCYVVLEFNTRHLEHRKPTTQVVWTTSCNSKCMHSAPSMSCSSTIMWHHYNGVKVTKSSYGDSETDQVFIRRRTKSS